MCSKQYGATKHVCTTLISPRKHDARCLITNNLGFARRKNDVSNAVIKENGTRKVMGNSAGGIDRKFAAMGRGCRLLIKGGKTNRGGTGLNTSRNLVEASVRRSRVDDERAWWETGKIKTERLNYFHCRNVQFSARAETFGNRDRSAISTIYHW